VAKLFADAGTIAITAIISPYAADRDAIRALHDEAKLAFLEVYVDAPIAVCESRDPKGMYKQARAGLIRGFTGIDDPYEPPSHPELVLKTGELSAAQSVARCIHLLDGRGCFWQRHPNALG